MGAIAPFTHLYFGMADSKNEAAQNPDAFIRSFVEPRNAINELRTRKKFLLLGPKGAGKSAVAWYMELSKSSTELVSVRDVSDLPITDIDKIKTGEGPGLTRGLTAWKLIVLCALLDVILQDQSSPLNAKNEVRRVENELRRRGFMDATLINAVLEATKVTYKIPIPHLGEIFSLEKTSAIHLYNIVPILQRWACSSQGTNRHTLILDGLDSIYLSEPQYFTSIASLVQAVYAINQQLRASESSAHVVLLARNDLFSRLPLADAGKIKEDFGTHLDWRVLSGEPNQARLFQLVNQKAGSLIDNPPQDIVQTYFPKDINLSGRTPRWVETYKFLLDHTRHTPRDLLRLFEYIRQAAEAGNMPLTVEGRLTNEIVKEGANQYVMKYFVDAIRNELVGLQSDLNGPQSDDEISRKIISTLRHLPRRTFTAQEFTQQHFGNQANESQAEADRILTMLFFAGALGNLVRGRSESYLQYYHRREESEIYLRGQLILHNSLARAWNIRWLCASLAAPPGPHGRTRRRGGRPPRHRRLASGRRLWPDLAVHVRSWHTRNRIVRACKGLRT